MGDIKLGSILLVAKGEYARWLSTPRIILLAVAFLPLRDGTVLPLLEASRRMGSPLNILEPCIATMNSWMGLLLFGLVYLVLMSPFPKADGNMLFYVARMGKRNWVLGEMLFQLLCAILYADYGAGGGGFLPGQRLEPGGDRIR